MTKVEFDPARILTMSDAEFADAMRRLVAAEVGGPDAASLQQLHAFVTADPRLEAAFAGRLRGLDAATRRLWLSPARLSTLLASVAAEHAPPPVATAAGAASRLEVLWSTGTGWIRTTLSDLRAWLDEASAGLVGAPVDLVAAEDCVMTLRERVFRGDGEDGDGDCDGGGPVEIPIAGSDLGPIEAAAVRLVAEPLRFERVDRCDATAAVRARGKVWRLRGSLRLEVRTGFEQLEQGVHVLLVSKDPGLAFAVALAADGGALVGALDQDLVLEDAPSALDRGRLQARVWRSPRNRKGRTR